MCTPDFLVTPAKALRMSVGLSLCQKKSFSEQFGRWMVVSNSPTPKKVSLNN